MSAGRDVLRVLWSEGLRVIVRPDGSLALTPPALVTADLVQLARDAKPEIESVVRALPEPNRCDICGDPDGWNDGKTQTRCTTCVQLAADRLLAELATRPRFLSDISERATA